MKRLLPLLLALLLLCACGASSTEEELRAEETPAAPVEEIDEDELPIIPEGASVPDPAGEDDALPALSDTDVTLDGISSYLRVTLPEGWTWEQAGGTADGVVYGLRPAGDPDFVVELHYWPEGFGMCGTGVTFTDYTLADGRKATIAYEVIGDSISWTMILPESPDAFTIQFTADMAVYEAHRAELEQMLGTIRQGVLAGLDVVKPEEATG